MPDESSTAKGMIEEKLCEEAVHGVIAILERLADHDDATIDGSGAQPELLDRVDRRQLLLERDRALMRRCELCGREKEAVLGGRASDLE